MTRKQKRRFYVALAVLVVALFTGGIVTGYVQRNDKICADGKPPVQQQDVGLGQIKYRCHNGQIVQK